MQRYTDGIDGMYEDEEGEWVKWEDVEMEMNLMLVKIYLIQLEKLYLIKY